MRFCMEKKSEIGFYVRLPDIEMRDAFKQYAKSQNRSMNGQVIELIKKALGGKK